MADQLSVSMQNEAIRVSESRLGRTLSVHLKNKIRLGGWGYMGLEAIIDTVRTIDLDQLETYLGRLEGAADESA